MTEPSIPSSTSSATPRRELRSDGSLSYPDAPIWQVLAGASRRWPDRIALADGEEALTWSRLWSEARHTAALLSGAGLDPGQVLGLQLRNSIGMAVAYWAGQLAGLTISPINPLQPSAGIERQLVDSGAAALITEVDGVLVLTSRVEAVKTAPVASLPLEKDFLPHVPRDLGAAVAHICYTGGTTGSPKGVTITQRGVVANVLQFAHWVSSATPARDAEGGIIVEQPGTAEEWPIRLGHGVVVAGAPWFHAMGLGGGLIVPALLGNRSLLLGRFNPASFLETVAREGVTSVSGAPAMLAALAQEQESAARDVSSVRLISCGGGPLPAALADRLATAFPAAVVTQAYGLTEVTMAAAGFPTSRKIPRVPGVVGLPMADTEIRLLETAAGSDLGGEILIRGPQVMTGYHARAEETNEVLTDGWLRTGDLGVIGDDGYLRVVDRSKDMLIFKGYNVYPSELEALLRDQAGVRDAAVVGLPDDADGELPVAFIVGSNELDPSKVMEAVNAQVVHYKKIRQIHILDALPVSAIGKVLKNELRVEAIRRHRLSWLNTRSGELVQRMGIRYTELGERTLVATMPVAGNRQGYDLLHGGASVVLAETVGSALAVFDTDFTRRAVGLEINATHHRPATGGLVTATAKVLARGRTTATVEVAVTDEADRRVCTCRLTCLLRDRPNVPAT